MGQQKSQIAHGNVHLGHPHFQQARLLTDAKQNTHFIEISQHIVQQSEVTIWQKNYKPLMNCECLLMPLEHSFQKSNICGSSGLCKIKYQNYPYLLSQQISDRSKDTKNAFSNAELWYLAFTLLEAASLFHARKIKVGDIQPGNVFINQHGQSKVANIYSWPSQGTNYDKTLFQKQITYLAPEEMKQLQKGHQISEAQDSIAQSFSIGLTLLDTACLSNSKDLYNISSFQFDFYKLEQRKQKLKLSSSYDDVIKQIILELTQQQVNFRIKCQQIFTWMEQYRSKIHNMQPFTIIGLPHWLKIPIRQGIAVQQYNQGISLNRSGMINPVYSPYETKPQGNYHQALNAIDRQLSISKKMFPY